MEIEGVPVAGIEVTGYKCWLCGEQVPRESETELVGMAVALKPQEMWELSDIPPNIGFVYIHKREWEAAMPEMEKAYQHLMNWQGRGIQTLRRQLEEAERQRDALRDALVPIIAAPIESKPGWEDAILIITNSGVWDRAKAALEVVLALPVEGQAQVGEVP